MIKLEIIVQPKTEKYIEFSQSLEFIRSNLQKLCMSLSVTEKDKTFSIVATMVSAEQPKNIASTLANILGTKPPSGADGEVLYEVTIHLNKNNY